MSQAHISIYPYGADVCAGDPVHRHRWSWADADELQSVLLEIRLHLGSDACRQVVVVVDFPFVRRHDGHARVEGLAVDLRSLLLRAGFSPDSLILRLADAVALSVLATVPDIMDERRLVVVTLTRHTTSASALTRRRLTDLVRGDFGSMVLPNGAQLHRLMVDYYRARPPDQPECLRAACDALRSCLQGLRDGSLFLGLLQFQFEQLFISADAEAMAGALRSFDGWSVETSVAFDPPQAMCHALLDGPRSYEEILELAQPDAMFDPHRLPASPPDSDQG